MRLLVVGHSYITPFAQAKYVAMKARRRDLAIRLVVPPVVHHLFGEYRPALAAGLVPEDLVILRSVGGSGNMSYLLDPVGLGSLMRRFAPTHVHIEEDPHSAMGAVTSWLAARICRDAVVSFFIWDNVNRTPRFPGGVVKRQLTRRGLSRARLVVCGNEQARSLLAAKGYHGASEVIPQVGLDPAAANAAGGTTEDRGESSSARPVPVIGYVGRLVEEKGIRDLFEALEQVLDCRWELVIRGSGPLRTEIDDRWRPVFGDRLVCLDAMPHADVHTQLARLDIFALPSYTITGWKEQFGLTLAQAMLAGCACVGSSSGAIPEVLAGAGLVFPERNVPALAGTLRTLLTSPGERNRLGSLARTVALARYTNEVVADRYLDAFDAAAN